MVFSILASALFSGYDSYLKIKKRNKFNEKASEYIEVLYDEIKYNMKYSDVICRADNNVYYMKSTDIDYLMNNEINTCITNDNNNSNEVCKLEFIKNNKEHNVKIKVSYEGRENYKLNKEFLREEFCR